MKPLNVIFTGRLSFPNGIASVKRRKYIIDYLNATAVKCRVVCLRQSKKDLEKFNNPDHGYYGATEFINFSSVFYHGLTGKVSYYKQVSAFLKKCYDENSTNVLIFHTSLGIDDLPFLLYGKHLGYKIIFDQVETSYVAKGVNISLKSKIYATINDVITKWGYRQADAFFVISTALQKWNRERYNQPICLLPNSTPIIRSVKKEAFSNPVKILYVGTFTPKDGVDYLVKAFKQLVSYRSDVRLILIGKGIKRDMDVIMSLIENEKNIEYRGYVDDDELYTVLRESDILTMTRSNSVFANFGFPFKLSEYLATGNPVIATNVSDVCLYLEDKKNACIAVPEDVESIFESLKYLVENEEKALEMGDNGLMVVKKHFDVDKNGKKFVEFLKQL
ncbi:glycosyltransferase family 4 protein [Pedobacter faecalis]|uniref:glycosyltransferase family 4 protein n=1 Tax=Pedobacter faecalis TaxID=3041495 RepID=UPI002551B079|nr:glycosyltransferase family 4 protein [Pedobacter sp. ELA7]